MTPRDVLLNMRDLISRYDVAVGCYAANKHGDFLSIDRAEEMERACAICLEGAFFLSLPSYPNKLRIFPREDELYFAVYKAMMPFVPEKYHRASFDENGDEKVIDHFRMPNFNDELPHETRKADLLSLIDKALETLQ